MRRKRVFIDGSAMADSRRSGIGHVVYSIVDQINKTSSLYEQYSFTLFVPWRQWHYLKDYQFENIKYKRLPFPGRVFNLLAKMKTSLPLDTFIGRGVYIFPNYKNWSLAFSKSITYIHDICFALYPEFVEPRNQRMLQKYMPQWIKRSNIVATDSYSSKKEIISYYGLDKEKVAVIPNGVDSVVFNPQSKSEIETIKKKYGLKGNYIFFLSNIEPRKNVLRLINTYRSLPEDVTSKYSLLIVGGMGWLNEDILLAIQQCQEEGLSIIKPDKYVPDKDLPALHSGASLLIQPSLHEGFGVAPLQAMACGTPVAASKIPALVELLGDAAVYFDPRSEQSIKRGILKVIESPKLSESLKSKGLERAKDFSWEETLKKLMKQIDKLVEA